LGLLLFVAAGCAQFSLDASHATGNCVRFVFPRWEVEGVWDFSGSAQLEFRSSSDSPSDLLVAVRWKVGFGPTPPAQYSTAKLRISLDRPGIATSVSDDTWNRAEILNHFPHVARSSEAYQYGQTLNPKGFEFDGKLVKFRGKYWGGTLRYHALHNPSKRYVALQSVTGKVRQDGEVYSGKAYVQVFDTRTAVELFWLEGNWKNRGSAVVFRNTEWIREDLLVVSFDPWLRRGVALCKVP
jgi:hypothetical protein